MHEWRRQAALGFWSNIDAVQILIDAETEDFVEGKPLEQLSDLRWALEQVVPFASLKNGFEDRFVRSASPGDVKRFIDQGRYRKALGTVKNRLCPDAEMSAEEKQRQTIEAHRELQRRREVQGGVELKDPMMAWEISQIRHAAWSSPLKVVHQLG